MIDLLLRVDFIRKKLLFHLKHKYFHELGHSIPLQSGYWAHLMEKDSYDSFSEIFIKQEYLEFIPDEPISRILDIGAHYGYFSLWLQSLNSGIELESLMIEPCSTCHDSIGLLIKNKKLKGFSHILDGAIDDPALGHASFFDRPFMASSSFQNSKSEESRKIKIITEDDIVEKMSPPYDLIKCDIEGKEWELLLHYPKVLSGTKYLILEWHSWHNGGKGKAQILNQLKSINFDIINESPVRFSVGKDGETGLILAINRFI